MRFKEVPMRIRLALLVTTLILTASVSQAQLDPSKLFKSDAGSSLSTGDIVAGLKQALEVGTTDTVALTGKTGGYFDNPAIKILLPSQLSSVDQGLRMLGQGDKVDAFVLSMNRAAEKAAPAAKDIFWGAIKGMTFEDARKILNGGDTAATEYFRAKTSESLTAAFRPVVTDSMKDVGVMQQYKQLQNAYQSVPFASSFQAPDIEAYVVSKALDGLFLVLGEQEKKIRTNPAAQVTDLLKKVFGK
jgi:hypothetical protein